MLNEKQKLAPDRERLNFGSDNNYEYKLYGYFQRRQSLRAGQQRGFIPSSF